MKIPLKPLLASLVCCTRLATAAAETAAAAPEPNPLDSKINTLLQGLSDESFRVREQSTQSLWELGEAALPGLRGAASSADPEKAIRARDLLRKIQLHITPDTDPSVIGLVESYHQASPGEKASLMGKMRGKRAWRQMLKLYAAETNAELRERLRPIMSAVATKAARERLMLDDAPGAREFLEMAPADPPGLLALAEFHRHHGTLEAELKRADGKDAKAAAWRLALQRAAGNAAAAREEAIAAGENSIAAVMAALEGDPLPFLNELRKNRDQAPVTAAYADIAAKRWQGKKVLKNEMAPLVRMLSSPDPSEQAGALGVMFLLGEAEAAEQSFIKSQPLAAFRHFEALERIPEALRALGLDPDKPDFKSWVQLGLDKLLKEDVGEQGEVSDQGDQLVALANFLERRGLDDTALEAFGGPLAAMAEKDPGAFEEFLGRLFGSRETLSGAPHLARAIGTTWAGDDEDRWEDIRVAAFGDDERNTQWWNWLAEIQPGTSRADRFEALLALGGMGRDPAGLRTRWNKLLWRSIDQTAEAGPRQERLERIAELAAETGDAANGLKAWDQLPAAGRDKVFWGLQIVQLTAAERWNEAAEVILKQIQTITEAKQDPPADLYAYAAGALRAAGRHEEAAEHDRRADRMALGNAAIAMRAGNGYAFGRDYQRAAAWWKKAAMQADPASEEFALAIKLHADVLLEQEQWPECAAVSEMVAGINAGMEYQWAAQLPLMRHRLQADMARALSRLERDRAESLATLARCHSIFASDGSLADFFFPALRRAGLLKEHDAWFLDSWQKIETVIARYPGCDNTRNTAAWFAARALRKLDAAEQHVRKALAVNPAQSAYLDTMAEIQFARGKRAKALEWSQLAVNFSPEDTLLRRQHERFRSEPFPR